MFHYGCLFKFGFDFFFCSLVFQRKQYNPFFVIVSKNAAHLKRRKYGSPVVIEYSLLTVIDRLLFYTDPLTCNCNPSVKVSCWYFGLFHCIMLSESICHQNTTE